MPTPSPVEEEEDDDDDDDDDTTVIIIHIEYDITVTAEVVGSIYHFEYYSNIACRDASGERYEFGAIDNVRGFKDCAKTCVQDVPEDFLPHFRGIDYVIKTDETDAEVNECRCLLDTGTLDMNTVYDVFDYINTDYTGDGYVGGEGTDDAVRKNRAMETVTKDVVCVKVVEVEAIVA